MKFTGHFTGIKFDLRAYKQSLNEHMKMQLHEVARAWLTAVTGRVPVWSGMARASLLILSEMVGGRIVIASLRAASRIPQGRPLGTATPTYGPTDFTIKISTSVPHYVLQERQNVGISKSAPWQSFEAGAIAYRAAAKMARLPFPIYKPVGIKAI